MLQYRRLPSVGCQQPEEGRLVRSQISVPSIPSSSYPSSGDSCGCRWMADDEQRKAGDEDEPASPLTSSGEDGAPLDDDGTVEFSEFVSTLLVECCCCCCCCGIGGYTNSLGGVVIISSNTPDGGGSG